MTSGSSPEKALPEPTPVTRPYWDALKAHELQLQHCDDCGRYTFYPRLRCEHCGKDALRWKRVSGRGTLHSYIINHVAPPGWEQDVPYVVAVVKLEEGPRMLSNLRGIPPDPEALQLDMPLEVAFVARGDMVVTVFEPLRAEGNPA